MREKCARWASSRYTQIIEIIQSSTRELETALKIAAKRRDQADGEFPVPPTTLSAPRAVRLNPHRRRRREGRGFVQPRSI